MKQKQEQGEDKEPDVKKYICTDCKTANYLEDNGEIRVGECRNCGHPLWNPADSVTQSGKELREELIKLLKDEQVQFTYGIKSEEEIVDNYLKSNQ